MARELTTYVWLSDEHGNPVGFGPGDEVPAWAADKIGDHCYADDSDKDDEGGKPKTTKRTSTRTSN